MNNDNRSAPPPRDKFELLVAGIRDYAIYMLDPTGRVSSWNVGAERLNGYTAVEVIDDHFSRFHTADDKIAGVPERSLQIALNEGKYETEGWRVRKNGSRFWASVVIDPIHDGSGALLGFATVTRDITERKRMQEELLASERQFRILVQGVTDYAIYMISPAGEVTNWNAGAERIKGYKAFEVLGRDFGTFYTPEDREAGLPKRALSIAQAEGKFEAEGWRVRKDGSRFWAHVVIDPLRDESGTLIGFAKITRDVTEKRRAAESLEQARTALFQSQKMEAIGRLTGGIAHDFNNLLSVVSGGIELLRSGRADKDAVLDTMRRAVERGAGMTQQLLAFARQQPLRPEKHDVNQLVASFEPVLRGAIIDTIDFRMDLAPRLSPVMIDPALFEASLLNLVVNARDAMPDGGRLVLSTRDVQLGPGEVGTLASGGYVRVSLTDTGSGMDEETMKRVFDPFFTTKPVGKGTGLGMSQVHGFIMQSGGEVALKSLVGQGTTVDLYLPAVE